MKWSSRRANLFYVIINFIENQISTSVKSVNLPVAFINVIVNKMISSTPFTGIKLCNKWYGCHGGTITSFPIFIMLFSTKWSFTFFLYRKSTMFAIAADI